jgi:hypothetical protein
MKGRARTAEVNGAAAKNGAPMAKNRAQPLRTPNNATPPTPPGAIFRDMCETLIQKLQEKPAENADAPVRPPIIKRHENEAANGVASLT